MELSPGGSVVPFPVSNSCQIRVGSDYQNTEGVVESYTDNEPEMYDFSSFLEGGILNDIFPEFKEMLKAAALPRIGLVVPEMVEEVVVANKRMEHHIQPPTPPQLSKPSINSSTCVSGSLKWTKELHAIFVDAVKKLGGAFIATPKTIRDIMNIEGLSLHQVKSHLQQYRTGKRLCNDLRKFYRRGSSFSRALGAPSKPAPSSQPIRAKKRIAKPNKQDNGSMHMKILFQKRPMQSCYPYQWNQYNGYTSAAGIHAGIFMGQNPDKLQSIPVAYPHQLTQASFPALAASGSYQQGFNSDAGESSGTAGMSEEEFIESFLIDCDELVRES